MPASSFDISHCKRGDTSNGPWNTVVTTRGADYLGREKWFEDLTQNSARLWSARSHRHVRCRFVKNSSGISLLPKRLVRFKVGTNQTEVDGYTHAKGQGQWGVVDEHLPADGVRNGDSFWVVMEGPSLVTTHNVGTAGSLVIAQGDMVIAATAATSQSATTAGKVELEAFADATAAATVRSQAVGVAMSAMTTGNTDSPLLVDVQRHL